MKKTCSLFLIVFLMVCNSTVGQYVSFNQLADNNNPVIDYPLSDVEVNVQLTVEVEIVTTQILKKEAPVIETPKPYGKINARYSLLKQMILSNNFTDQPAKSLLVLNKVYPQVKSVVPTGNVSLEMMYDKRPKSFGSIYTF